MTDQIALMQQALELLMLRDTPDEHSRCVKDGKHGHLGACFAVHKRTADAPAAAAEPSGRDEQACVPCVAFYALTGQQLPLATELALAVS